MSQNKNDGGPRKAPNVPRERGARFFVRLNAELVLQARLIKDVTQTRAAIECDIDIRTYKRAEAGQRIDVETARSVGDYYGRDYTELLRKPEQAEAQSVADDEMLNSQALGTNESSIDEERPGGHRNSLSVPPRTQVVAFRDDDERQSFSLLGVGGMDAITDYAYDNGFVLFSEQDVKQFYLSLADRVKEDAQSRFIHTIVEMYSKATDGPSRLYVTVNNGDALKAWVAKQFDRICQRMEKGDQDFLRDSNTQEIKAELLAHVSPGGVIVSLQAWHILEQLIIRKAKGKKPWWQELDFMVRKGDLSFRTAQNIKMFHIVLQTVLANGDYASALDPDLLVTLTLFGFVFSTKLTGVELR